MTALLSRSMAFVLMCLAAVTALVPKREAAAAATNAIYWTSEKLEPDTVASAWLLQRFAAPDCTIRLLPRGEHSEIGTPFDVPLVPLSRNRTQSTYHVIRLAHGLTDARLLAIERLVDEVEIAAWNAVPSKDAVAFERRLRACIERAPSPESALAECCDVLNEIYATLPSNE